jgi:diguanylate cyclase (GGDEF)-like protein/PAS domain S-box-containing protein
MLSAIFDPASYAFNACAVPTLATAGAMLLFAVVVLFRERGSREALQFTLLAGTISVWLTCFSIMYLSAGAGMALVWARSAYLGIGFIPAALYGFAVAMTRGRHRRLVRAGWLISAGFTLVMLTSGALVRDLYHYWWGYYPRFRWLGLPFLVFFFTMLALSLREYWHDYRTASPGTHRRRTRLLMTGFAIAYLGSFDYVAAYGVPLYPFGYAPVLVFIAILAHTIRRYRLVAFTPAFAAGQILATVADPVIVCDSEGKIRFTNDAASTVFGYDPGELAGAPIERLAEPLVGSTVRLHLTVGEVVRDAEMVFRTRQGEAVEVGVSLSPLVDDQGHAVGAVLLARDIRARKRAEAALRKSEESYRTLFERNQAGVFRTSAEGVILDCNDAFARILGYASRRECIGRSMVGHYADPGQRPPLFETLRAKGVLSDQEVALRKVDGSPAWVLANADLLEARDAEPEMLEGTVIDITQRRNAESQIVYQALHDALTGLPNRMLFYDRLTQALAQGRRHDDRLAVLFLDLDQFKVVNDTLGHAAGDRLLVEIAGRLQRTVRASDTVARVGGDEFTFLLPGIDRAEDAARAAQKILDAVSRPLEIDGHQLYVTTSIGISLFPADGEEAEALLSGADIAMYRAKDLGRNGYQLSSPAMNAKSLARLTLERDLRMAIERGELSLVYQPQAGVVSGRTVGFEALLRWNHPQRGVVLPGEFIAIAEETRLILPLGEWVLRTACEQARRWQAGGGPRPRVAVNLSALQLSQRNLASTVQSTLRETGIDPGSLELEITESAAMLNAEQTIDVLSELREMGVRISIDDFGTGHASLSYLKQFPIDALKIDRSFVADMEASREGLAIITAITGLAHGLGLGVIAEGVESDSQLRLLAACGCDEYQGFLLSQPLAPATVPGFLDRSKRSAAVPLS